MVRNHSGAARRLFIDCPQVFILLFVLVIGLCAASRAATIEKADNSANLTVGSSWVGGVVPGGYDSAQWDATLSGNHVVPIGGNLTLGQLIILDPGGPVLLSSPGTLTLNGLGGVGIDMSASTQNLTLNCPVVLGGGQTWNVAANTTLTVSGAISGGFGLTIAGSGTTVISGTNRYTGGTTVIGGTLKMSSPPPQTSTSASSSIAVMPGGSLDLGGRVLTFPAQANPPANYTLSIAGGGVGGNGALVNSSGNATVDSIWLADDATLGGTSPWSVSLPAGGTAIRGNGYNLTKTGSNVITFNGASDGFTVTGVKNILINAGMLNAVHLVPHPVRDFRAFSHEGCEDAQCRELPPACENPRKLTYRMRH